MFRKWQENTFFYYLLSGITSWLIFLISFLLLTQGIMYVMELEGMALLFLTVGVSCLVVNYVILKKLFVFYPKPVLKENMPIFNYHQLIDSLERIFRVIILLTSLGLIVSLMTFFFISMEYFTSHSMDTVIELVPIMFVTYLLFIIPSFYGLREINNIKLFLNEFENTKAELKNSITLG